MKTITLAVPDEEIKSLEAFLHQSKITVIDEAEDDIEVSVYEVEIEEIQQHKSEDYAIMEQLEKVLEEEIWKLHHFAE